MLAMIVERVGELGAGKVKASGRVGTLRFDGAIEEFIKRTMVQMINC